MRRLAATAAMFSLLAPAALGAQGQRLGVRALGSLPRYVGTYPCTNGIIVSPALQNALARTLGKDFAAYQKHLGLSSCGPIEREGQYIVMDESRMGVGGYSSLIYVRLPDEAMYVFWLDSLVTDKVYRIYGPRPIPPDVMSSIVRHMNDGWGQVATFSASGEKLSIVLKKPR